MRHDYLANPQKKIQPVDNGEVEQTVVDIEEKKPITGIVTNCLKLNVRKTPDAGAEILTVISALTEVEVSFDDSTNEFYKVCTKSGVEGFCMKKYIALHT